MSTKIRVSPTSVQAYGRTAQQQFSDARRELEQLVRDCVNVQYYGTNASQFKRECGEMAADFSGRLLKDMASIADAVRGATTNIARSLGGSAVNISVDGSAVAVPAVPKADGSEEVNITALRGLVPTVRKHFQTVDRALQANLKALQGTDWEGQAKRQAVDAVSKFTKTAAATSNKASTSVVDFINKQVESTLAADKTLG